MALVSFGYRVDMFAIDPPLEVGAYIVAYDLDGVLKQKDHLGVVTLVGAGAGGPQGPPGPVGPAGLTWSGTWMATQSYSLNYAVGYGSASWWCISDVTGATSNTGPDVDTTHWALLAAQGSPGSQGGTGSQGLQGPQGEIGLNWIGDWIVNVYDVRDAVYYNGSSYVCIASTVGTETLSPDTNTPCWDIISLRGDVGPQGATGPQGVTGSQGETGLYNIFYNVAGTVSATNSTDAIYRTGSINIGTGTASDSRFLVSSSGGTVSLVVTETGRVGIGTTSPSTSLHSVGDFRVDNNSGYLNIAYHAEKSGEDGIIYTSWYVPSADNRMYQYISEYSDTGLYNIFYHPSTGYINGNGGSTYYMYFQTGYDDATEQKTVFQLNGNDKLTLKENGTIIIGGEDVNSYQSILRSTNAYQYLSNSPGKDIKIQGGAGRGTGNGGSILFETAKGITTGNTLNTHNTIMSITQDGNVGIGTSSPSTKLHIYATQSGAFRLVDGTQGSGKILVSDSNGVGSWTSSTVLVTGTYAVIDDLVTNNQLVVGGTYILTQYQTIYQINGSNTTGIVSNQIVIGVAASVYSQFVNVPSNIGGPGNFAGVTVTVSAVVPGATLTVGQTLTIIDWFSSSYIRFSPTVVGVNIGCTLKFEKQRYANVTGGATYSDIYGKPIMKPGGVLNIEVHDGNPYMSMTASENPAVLTESIILRAIDTNKFSREAESLTFPGDKLIYDYTDKYVYDENGNVITTRPGNIIQRTNISGSISMNKDWRVQRYRRYAVDSTNWSRLTLATASVYKLGANSVCTTTNTGITIDNKYIASEPYISNFYTDFTNNVANIFLTGTNSASTMSDGARSNYELSGYEYSNILNISSFTSSVKDFNILPILNGEPTNLIEKCVVDDVSNTVFLPYSQTYGTTFNLHVDSKNGNITNSTFTTLPSIVNTGIINKLTVIDFITLNNFSTYNQRATTDGSILNTLMLSYSSIYNTGEIVNTTIGGGQGASTAFNNINFSNSVIHNCVIGGHRNNNMEIKSLKANKSLICFNQSTLISITGNSYLTALKNQSTAFYSSDIKLNNFDLVNPNKSLYGYLYDFNVALSDKELNNNTLDKRLVYQYLDNSNNIISVTVSTAQ